jgi:hypothetical protein
MAPHGAFSFVCPSGHVVNQYLKVDSMKDVNKVDFPNRNARERSRFSCLDSERNYNEKLNIATALRNLGAAYTAEFNARTQSLQTLQNKLQWIEGCIASV